MGQSGAGFLSPYKVLDLTDHRGLLAGRMLGQLGADVVQVEPPGGSPARGVGPFAGAPGPDSSLYWSAYASAKRGITCDLGDHEGRTLLRRLVAQADFLLESETPGVMAERGLAWEDLRAVNPGLIHISITAFGSTGPKSDWAESDIVLWAAGGALYPARDGDRPPLRISAPQAWLHAASDAAGGALMAHFARLRTGVGQHVDISAQCSVAECTLSVVLAHAVGDPRGSPPPQDSPPPARPPRSSWETRDGKVEMALGVGAVGGASSNALFAWMREEGESDPRFDDWDWIQALAKFQAGLVTPEEIEVARSVVARFFAKRPTALLVREALERRILLTQIQTAETLCHSEHFRARGVLEEVAEAGGLRTLPHVYAKATGAFTTLRPAPRIGQHNAEVYEAWLGLDEAEVAALAARGVI